MGHECVSVRQADHGVTMGASFHKEGRYVEEDRQSSIGPSIFQRQQKLSLGSEESKWHTNNTSISTDREFASSEIKKGSKVSWASQMTAGAGREPAKNKKLGHQTKLEGNSKESHVLILLYLVHICMHLFHLLVAQLVGKL